MFMLQSKYKNDTRIEIKIYYFSPAQPEGKRKLTKILNSNLK